MSNGKSLLVALDVGTSKVAVLVGEPNPGGAIEVVGTGMFPSNGLSKGAVVNIESTVQAIQKAVNEAEMMAGCTIQSVFTGISGSHVRSHHSSGAEQISEQEVRLRDIKGAIDAARAIPLPANHKILHVLPNEFVIDDREHVKDPTGLSGARLEAKVHVVSIAENAEQNIQRCIQRCGLRVDKVVLQPLASGDAVLNEDEKELGVCLIDIGGGTTDVAVYRQSSLHYTSVIPIAGDQVTNDIAVALRTPLRSAEQVKLRYACAHGQLVDPTDMIEVPSLGERQPRRMERQNLAGVVQPRYEELFQLVRKDLQHNGLEELVVAGVVLTGGSSRVQGLVELAEEVFEMPVRRGLPQHVTGPQDVISDPAYATGIGLLLYAWRETRAAYAARPPRGMVRAWHGVLNWFKRTF